MAEVEPGSALSSTSFQESLGNILNALQDSSSQDELLLAEIFTRLFHFERQVEQLKVQLFKRELATS